LREATGKALTIQNAKFGKSRLVPIHPSTQKVLAKYLHQRERFLQGRTSPYLFTLPTITRPLCPFQVTSLASRKQRKVECYMTEVARS
jgi:site-specific recombinase XerD